MHSKRPMFFITLLLTIVFVGISTPWSWGATFFGDSKIAWVVYYVLGTVLTFYTIWVFLRALKVLLNHMSHHFKEEGHE